MTPRKGGLLGVALVLLAGISSACADDSSSASGASAGPTVAAGSSATTASTAPVSTGPGGTTPPAPSTTAGPSVTTPTSTETTAAPGATTVAETSGAAVEPPPTAPPMTAEPVDGPSALTAAMDVLGATYHYHSTVDVAGGVVLVADGDRVGDGTRVGVERQGAVVQYVITPEGTWVQVDDEQWDELDTAGAAADPITALRAPTTVAVAAADPSTIQLVVTVPLVALGIPGDGTADLAVTLVEGAISSVAYTTTLDGQVATVISEFGPVIDGSPVVAPG